MTTSYPSTPFIIEIEDDCEGMVRGIVTEFDHEGKPLAIFADGTKVVLHDGSYRVIL